MSEQIINFENKNLILKLLNAFLKLRCWTASKWHLKEKSI